MSTNFSERMGIEFPEPPISIRNDAPEEFRRFLLTLMLKYAQMKKVRTAVCFITKIGENPNNWGENDFMREEIQTNLLECFWSRIYDIIEYFYKSLGTPFEKVKFEKEVNEYFREKGYGWKLENGIIKTRGEEAFEQKIKQVVVVLGSSNYDTSKNEINEALKDLSKRPVPDITGSIQHSVAALECLCREITGDKNETLGRLIKNYPTIVPEPLNKVIHGIFGFASIKGRHLEEGETPSFEEAELVVHLCASLCVFLAKKP